jgi:hypothetical protein
LRGFDTVLKALSGLINVQETAGVAGSLKGWFDETFRRAE